MNLSMLKGYFIPPPFNMISGIIITGLPFPWSERMLMCLPYTLNFLVHRNSDSLCLVSIFWLNLSSLSMPLWECCRSKTRAKSRLSHHVTPSFYRIILALLAIWLPGNIKGFESGIEVYPIVFQAGITLDLKERKKERERERKFHTQGEMEFYTISTFLV